MTEKESRNPSMFKWLVFIVVLLFVYHIREVFPPFIVGGIIAYLLFPLVTTVNSLNRFRILSWMNPRFAVLFIYLTTAGFLGFLAYKFGPLLHKQVSDLIFNRLEIVSNLVTQISEGFHLGLAPEELEQTSKQILQAIENGIGKPEELVHLGGLLSHGLLSLLVCIVSSIYFMVDSRSVGRFFLRFVPEQSKTTAVNMIAQMNLMLSKYVLGQLVLIVLMSCVAGLFLTFLKVKYAVVIAILSGIFEIIPVLGPFIAISIAVIVGVSQYGINIALPIIVFYFVARQLEDYYVIPLIIGRAVELHALAVIFAVLVGETMAGALGMLIAIPVAASIKVILDTFYPPEEHVHEQHEEPNLVARIVQFALSPFHSHGDKKAGSDDKSEQKSEQNRVTGPNNGDNDDQKQNLIDWAHNKGNNEDLIIKTKAKEEASKLDQAELVEKAAQAKQVRELQAELKECGTCGTKNGPLVFVCSQCQSVLPDLKPGEASDHLEKETKTPAAKNSEQETKASSKNSEHRTKARTAKSPEPETKTATAKTGSDARDPQAEPKKSTGSAEPAKAESTATPLSKAEKAKDQPKSE